MKKTNIIKRFFCIVLSIVLVAISMSVSAFAVEKIVTVEVAGEQCMQYSGQKITESTNRNYYSNGLYSFADVEYSSYSLLSAHEKELYDRIVSTPLGTMSFIIEYSPYLTKTEFEAIDFAAIMYAVCLDHPEIFWYNGYSYGYSYVKSTGAVVSITYILKSPNVQGTTTPVYTESDIVSNNTAMWNEFHRVAEELNLEKRSRYSFVKELHDYLCNNVDYVNDSSSCFDPYGTLVNGDAVCQGYAETFKMFCDYYGIPVVNISGTGNGGAHMWNAVQMEDGIWYLMDITWDDQSPYIYYDFFLVGLQTKDEWFGGKAFNVSHVADNPSYLPSLNYASDAFEIPSLEYFNATYNSYTYLGEGYIALSPFDAPEKGVYYEGLRVDDIDFTTGSQFTTPDGKNWTVVMIGDVDEDGDVTNTDYQRSINIALRGDHKVQSTEDFAADVCRDGYINVLDVHLIQLMQEGLRTDIEVA